MAEYMLAVKHVGEFPEWDPDEMQAAVAAVEEFNAEAEAAGAWVFGGGLQPVETATTVRLKDGDTMLTDGPFAETKEVLGGFWVLRAEDLDEALAWARKAAIACRGDVEVRPFQDEPEA